jgi:hypothetical protein
MNLTLPDNSVSFAHLLTEVGPSVHNLVLVQKSDFAPALRAN